MLTGAFTRKTKDMNFQASEKLLNFIRQAEGLRLRAYRDTGGVWTIGYGHTKGVAQGMDITGARADELLAQDVEEAGRQVDVLYTSQTQGQRDALTDFVFNLGYERLRQSTLLKYIVLGKPTQDIQKEFRRWVYGTERGLNPATGRYVTRKKVLPGLKKRREWEAQRWAEKDTPSNAPWMKE